MASHKSAAVAARQRVHDHLQAQIDALTTAVETGIGAVERLGDLQAERARVLADLDAREQDARGTLADAAAQLQGLKKTRAEISELLGLTAAGITLPTKKKKPAATKNAPGTTGAEPPEASAAG
ncbi:hypothetical protein CLV47_11882 [Antricoccus suffuscus]|uniref:Uncharacterized protein n=1 Tax=Antricoccus suffuscus TaxID=1629062 RepID=A0A2T0ZUF9_9ACTN|nr:hypothetical protein [Antricoccus suffuscus]PRZ39718.1 hypothetical protein CLV47_11882 [Antricoccus suffuscus]